MSTKSLRRQWNRDKKDRVHMEDFLCTRYEWCHGTLVIVEQHHIKRESNPS